MMPLCTNALQSLKIYISIYMQQTKQSTKMGALMSLLSLTIMLLLFFCETFDFLFKSTRISSYVEIDNKNSDQLLRVNFNVTLYDVQCEFVEVGTYILLCLENVSVY